MSIEFTQVIEMGKIVVVLKKNLKKREKYPPEGLILAFFLCYDVGVKTINKFNPIPYSTLKNSYFVVYRRGLGNI